MSVAQAKLNVSEHFIPYDHKDEYKWAVEQVLFCEAADAGVDILSVRWRICGFTVRLRGFTQAVTTLVSNWRENG